MRRFVRENSLSLFFLTIFLATLVAQSFAGQHAHSAEQVAHGGAAVSWATYVTSSHYWGAVMENWQSEFLQFALYVVAARSGSSSGAPSESKKPGDEGARDRRGAAGGATRRRGARRGGPASAACGRAIYANSLLLVFDPHLPRRPGSRSRWPAGARSTTISRHHQAATISWARIPRRSRLLGALAPELAVRVPRRRDHGDLRRLPPPARLAGEQARRGAAWGDRPVRLGRPAARRRCAAG